MTDSSPNDDRERVIDLSVEVVGTPEEVWRAIATGGGISSWYVPTTVEERENGALTNRFGEGPDLQIPGRVAVWDPPHRVVFDDGAEGLAFEWLIEARAGGTCLVRLVNSGFVPGSPWDDQYDGMSQGWLLFLRNLQLHLAHFAGRTGCAMLPGAMWSEPRDLAFARLVRELGLPEHPISGSRFIATGDAPPLAGEVVTSESWRMAVLLDSPAPGTGILAAEGAGEQSGVSVWLYLYGDEAKSVIDRDASSWVAWLEARAPAP
jgi:uncharacterized protein YndB with AHSA1/START domain